MTREVVICVVIHKCVVEWHDSNTEENAVMPCTLHWQTSFQQDIGRVNMSNITTHIYIYAYITHYVRHCVAFLTSTTQINKHQSDLFTFKQQIGVTMFASILCYVLLPQYNKTLQLDACAVTLFSCWGNNGGIYEENIWLSLVQFKNFALRSVINKSDVTDQSLNGSSNWL